MNEKIKIDVPVSNLVTLESLKFNIKCAKEDCGRSWGRTIYPDENGEFYLSRGWAVCTVCAEKRMEQEIENA